MTETCQHCGKVFENTKALGSHIHYAHNNVCVQVERAEKDEERFRRLLDSCLSERNLPRPRHVGKIEEVICEIPEGVSPAVDRYREALKCALRKEKLVKEFDELLREPNAEKAE